MEQHTAESNNNHHNQSNQQCQSIALVLAAHMNSQQEQQTNSDNNEDESDSSSIQTISSQPISISSWTSSTSIGSTSTDVRVADKVFDQIEDLLSDFMRDPSQHHLHCRVLRWSPEDDASRIIHAVIVVNPPVMKK